MARVRRRRSARARTRPPGARASRSACAPSRAISSWPRAPEGSDGLGRGDLGRLCGASPRPGAGPRRPRSTRPRGKEQGDGPPSSRRVRARRADSSRSSSAEPTTTTTLRSSLLTGEASSRTGSSGPRRVSVRSMRTVSRRARANAGPERAGRCWIDGRLVQHAAAGVQDLGEALSGLHEESSVRAGEGGSPRRTRERTSARRVCRPSSMVSSSAEAKRGSRKSPVAPSTTAMTRRERKRDLQANGHPPHGAQPKGPGRVAGPLSSSSPDWSPASS